MKACCYSGARVARPYFVCKNVFRHTGTFAT